MSEDSDLRDHVERMGDRLEKAMEKATSTSIAAVKEMIEAVRDMAKGIGDLTRAVEVSQAKAANGNGNGRSYFAEALQGARESSPNAKSLTIGLTIVSIVGTLVLVPFSNRMDRIEGEHKALVEKLPGMLATAIEPIRITAAGNANQVGGLWVEVTGLKKHADEVEGQIRNLGSFVNEFEQDDQLRAEFNNCRISGRKYCPFGARDWWPEFGRVAPETPRPSE